ncbi:hypothetical protein C8R43DRAFT_1129924 [Mycena crocata]|nr:hypothetical protein C8R43DRAFT_1129924 [Mycena crocata]
MAMRELLPEPRKRDPNAPPPRKKGRFIFLGGILLWILWTEVENYLDSKPLLEKKRKRILLGRFERLREGIRVKPIQLLDNKSVLAYLRLLLDTMVPEEYLQHARFEEVYALLEEEIPAELLLWLREVCSVTYDLSQVRSENDDVEKKNAESIQDAGEEMLRRCYATVFPRLPPPAV